MSVDMTCFSSTADHWLHCNSSGMRVELHALPYDISQPSCATEGSAALILPITFTAELQSGHGSEV